MFGLHARCASDVSTFTVQGNRRVAPLIVRGLQSIHRAVVSVVQERGTTALLDPHSIPRIVILHGRAR
jgi:hypothetical protein